jgi:hypothetical protein
VFLLVQSDKRTEQTRPARTTDYARPAVLRWTVGRIFTWRTPDSNLVRQVLQVERTEVLPSRQSSIDAYLPFLDAQRTGGYRKGTKFWRCLKRQGFHGSLRVVSEWVTRCRRAQKVSDQRLQKVPSAYTIARLMTVTRDHTNKAGTVTVAAIQIECRRSLRLMPSSSDSTP